MKKTYLLFVLLSALLWSCNNTPDDETGTTGTSTETNTGDDSSDFVEEQTWDSTISIVWSGSSASVSGAADGVSVVSESGVVTVTSTAKHVEYALSGSGSGQLNIYSDYKFKLSLNGLRLSCGNGPAINNQCGKTCYVVLTETSVLSDGSTYATSTEDRKAAFFSEGQLIVSGSGTLSITGNYNHALASDDYIRVREGVLNLTANVSDGMHANDGIIIDDGTITVRATGDGIQCDTSSIVISGGTVNVAQAGDKGLLACTNIEVSGGTITVNSTDKGIKAKGNISISGGDITVIAGSSASYAPGGGHGGGWGSSSGAEGIEAKGTLTITDGKVYAQASDDAINSGGDLTISGGYVCAYSTGNDGMDANGNCYIKGGVVYAIGSSSPEVAIDANTEQQKKLYVQGGTLVAVGGLESGSSLTQSCYSASSWSSNTWYALTYNNNVFAFKTPSSGGTPLVVSASSTPTLTSGVTVSGGTSVFNGMGSVGATVSGGSSVSLSSYSGGGGMGGNGGGPGGGHGGGHGGW